MKATAAKACAVALLALAAAYVLVPFPRTAIFEALVWTMLVGLSATGYGSLVARVSGLRATLPLKAVWGLSLLTLAGGWAALGSVFRTAWVFAVCFGGLALLAHAVVVTDKRAVAAAVRALTSGFRGPAAIAAWLLGMIVLVIPALGTLHPYDDSIAYTAFPQKLIHTGTLIEPFSLRRLASLGGQTIQLGYLWPRIEAAHSLILDRGLGLCLLGLLLSSLAQRSLARTKPWSVALAMGICCVLSALALVTVAINSASTVTSALWSLAAFLTLHKTPSRAASSWRAFIPAALTLATYVSFRPFHALPALGMAVAHFALTAPQGAPRISSFARSLAILAGVAAVALFGLVALSMRSHGTPLYPFIRGTGSPVGESLIGGHARLSGHVTRLVTWFGQPRVACTAAVVVFGAFSKQTSRSVKAFAGVQLLSSFAIVALLGESDSSNLERYSLPLLLSAAWTILLRPFGGDAAHEPGANQLRSLLSASLLFAVSVPSLVTIRESAPAYISKIDFALHARARKGHVLGAEELQLREAQSAIPAGRKVATLVDMPYYLDFGRNDLALLDMPGFASPAPGMPFFAGAEPVAQYLRGLGYTHVLFVRTEFSQYYYRRGFRAKMLSEDEALWQGMAALSLDLEDNFAELARSYHLEHDKGGLCVINLEQKAP